MWKKALLNLFVIKVVLKSLNGKEISTVMHNCQGWKSFNASFRHDPIIDKPEKPTRSKHASFFSLVSMTKDVF